MGRPKGKGEEQKKRLSIKGEEERDGREIIPEFSSYTTWTVPFTSLHFAGYWGKYKNRVEYKTDPREFT
jgi:hypothetical protein